MQKHEDVPQRHAASPPDQIFSLHTEIAARSAAKMSRKFVKALYSLIILNMSLPVTDVIGSCAFVGFTSDPENWTANIHVSVLGGFQGLSLS